MSLIPRSSLFDLDRFFDDSWSSFQAPVARNQAASALAPRVDVRDTEGAYEISAELPGVKKEDVHVHLNDGVLTIEAESRQEDTEEKNGRIIRQERRYGKFVRSFDLGKQVHEGDITASFDNGVLKLTAPKVTHETPTPRRIEIA